MDDGRSRAIAVFIISLLKSDYITPEMVASLLSAEWRKIEDTHRLDADLESFKSGYWSDFKFGEPIDGRPQAKMETTSLKFYDFELAAIDAAAKKEGISRSAFIRRACGNELVALA